MTHATRYPGADTMEQWRGAGGVTMTTVNKLLLHTTESSGWPSYPSFAPTLTFNPWKPRGSRWRQHYPVNGSASTLDNDPYTTINRINVCQIEIVGYCDWYVAQQRGQSAYTIDKISGDAYKELGEFLAWIRHEWEVPISSSVKWKPYRIQDGTADGTTSGGSYGISNGIRLTWDQFKAYAGLCGHQHAPGNAHGDPGNLNIQAILTAAEGIPATSPYPTPKTADVYLSKLKLGQTDSDSVWQLQNALNVITTGSGVAPLPLTGDFDKATADRLFRGVFDAGNTGVTIHNDL